jgi:UDP-glucuronate 4-epimerase
MAGVRPSTVNPALYYDVNLNGTLTLLVGALGRLGAPPAPGSAPPAPQSWGERNGGRGPRFVFSSTSSVYGASSQIPFVETDPCDRPLAPYAASKRAAEMLGYSYHHLHGLQFTALRFFTVYGPRNRPDMMAYKLAESIFAGREVPLYNDGQIYRDWTFVGDIVRGVLAAVDRPLGYEVINLGRGEPVLLADFVRLVEERTGRRARLVPALKPDEDMPYTSADISKARRLLDYDPQVSVAEGVARLLEWYQRAVR